MRHIGLCARGLGKERRDGTHVLYIIVLCPGVIDWQNCGNVLGALESGWGLVLDMYTHSVTFIVGMGPL